MLQYIGGDRKDAIFSGRLAIGGWDRRLSKDVPHGKGILVYSNNDRYVGGFDHGYRSVYGILTDKNGIVIFEGQWKNDIPVY
ncbi:hypothetical protein AGMMS49949_08550 [Alphaproteobacteria bacterium]|nr:hypothetical protein AGMMS49949_08550 [Alphaproteobacteria bacterium]GHT00204.1 hypothetical protein AGMMS50296_8480 [Alphaproteobacteria bacterium]